MLTVALGLSGAIIYGFADFLGGLASKTFRAITVAALAAAFGLVPLLVGLALVTSHFSAAALLWGTVGGLSGGIGVLLLYAALAVGPMSVLSPLTAVFSGLVPVVVGVARGATLSPLGLAALVVATAAIVLVAAVRDESGARLTARGIAAAVAAGCGFGGLVLAYDATPADSGVAPLLVARTLQALLLGGIAVGTGLAARGRMHGAATAGPLTSPGGRVAGGAVVSAPPTSSAALTPAAAASAAPAVPLAPPTPHAPAAPRSRRALVWAIIGCGVADAGANIFIQAGLHSSTAPSTLPTMSVLNALYPIGTVVLAGAVLHERLTRIQTLGIVLAIAASIGLALS